MSFTVLGASGVLGRRIVGRLRAAGESVFAPARGDNAIFGKSLGHVIYAIGLTADFRERPYDTVQAHVSYLARVLEGADFDSLLYLSSTRVYTGVEDGCEDAILRVHPESPSDLYNLSKLMGESLCHACGRDRVRVARLSNVVGGDEPDSQNFIPSLLREAASGHVVLRTALSSAKDYIHVDDVVEVLLRIACEGRYAVYNVAAGRQVTHAEWIQRIVELTGCSFEVAPDAPVVRFGPVNVARITDQFRFVPRSVYSALSIGDRPRIVR